MDDKMGLISILQRLLPFKATTAENAYFHNYLANAYPRNHTYRIKKGCVKPYSKLAKRYRQIKPFYETPLTSLLEIGCAKGYFIFDAAKEPTCTRSLGIDVHQPNIAACLWTKNQIPNCRAQFENINLHELVERLDDFGGPFQTVLLLNTYQYLYFGSRQHPDRYLDHQVIFKHLKTLCKGRIIFCNRVHVDDCQSLKYLSASALQKQHYTEQHILKTAAEFFIVKKHGQVGRCPLYTFDS
jgi:hypothetical protein